MSVSSLPKPKLERVQRDDVACLTDDSLAKACGVRVAFTERCACTDDPFDKFNLSTNVEDDAERVAANRKHVLAALGAANMPVIVPMQVHGTDIVQIESSDSEAVNAAQAEADDGADAVLVETPGVAAMLCFADCVPVIIVSPSGAFSVVHAGWRGVEARIAPKAVQALAEYERSSDSEVAPSDFNVYIGPHIHACCFEVSPEVHGRFVDGFGAEVASDETHIDLNKALRNSLAEVGVSPERIADADSCTVCNSETWFSYRANDGKCGRHGAITFRELHEEI